MYFHTSGSNKYEKQANIISSMLFESIKSVNEDQWRKPKENNYKALPVHKNQNQKNFI